MMEKQQQLLYLSPHVRIVEVNAQAIVCQSGDTEKITLGGGDYYDDAWE